MKAGEGEKVVERLNRRYVRDMRDSVGLGRINVWWVR